VHNTEFNLDALGAIGIPIVDRTLRYPVTADAGEEVAAWLRTTGADRKLRVAVNTGGGWYTKRWGLDHFASLADTMIERFDAAVILTWGPGQYADVEEVKARMKHAPLIPPETTLPQLAALLKACTLVVSNDSGPMHLATAVGTPVLGIYGPTNPMLQGPYGPGHCTVRREGLDCLGCNLTSCPIGHPCMLDLSVATVVDAVLRLMETNGIVPTRMPGDP
jgi:ADP-heptose:LPS heptosyltransferase